MPRRPTGEGTGVTRFVLATYALLLLPWIGEAQQQSSVRDVRRQHESPAEAVVPEALHTLHATTLSHAPGELETPLNGERRKKTLSASHNDIFKQINEHHDASAIATLAPAAPAVRAPPSRKSGLQTAGLSSPHIARSLEDWEVEDFVLLATVDGKLYANDRKTGRERWAVEVDRPMVETTYYRKNKSSIAEDYRPVDDYLWIIEPSQDGSLFVYIPGGPNPGLVNTGLTMKKLVEEMAPYADEEPPVVYTGDKKTTMVTLDARTGRMVKYFGSAGAMVNDEQSCFKTNQLIDHDGEECSLSDTLTLGRTEYTVGIQGKDGHPIATLRYAEWGPNNYNNDLNRQYHTTLDGKYVYSKHDGSVFGWDHATSRDKGELFIQKFSAPVVRVFDIARPWAADNKDPELMVLPQPLPPMDGSQEAIRQSRIFLNQTEEGSWYAMSGNSYPLAVEGVDQAHCDRVDWWDQAPSWKRLNDAEISRALVGLHSVETIKPERRLTIAGPTPDELQNESFGMDMVPSDIDELSVINRVKQIPQSAVSSLFDFIRNPFLICVLVAFAAMYWKQLTEMVHGAKEKESINKPLTVKAETELPDIAEGQHIERATAEKPTADVQPIVTIQDVKDSAAQARPDSPSEGTEPLQASREGSMESADTVPPLDVKEKKKAHRGRRGGVKHKKGRAKKAASDGDEDVPDAPTVEDAVRDAQKLGMPAKLEPDQQTMPGDVMEVSGPVIRLGSLEVNTEKLIGTGSNGTMVFEGKFDGREVAVKRMLIQFFDIASQETKLLRESDDHPNVIRYFAQQQSHGFLYIALELCPASLADVIEKPHQHRSLAEAGEKNLPDVLYQITNGLQHLHNLRIVHRDLKPQNILVGNGKNGRPRLLVSDFGLCKKLEGEQSSFRATTAHAAGTSGWRAPELLLDDDARDRPHNDGHSSVMDSTDPGSGSILVSDVMPGNRRATRAIDIFSLGLVFFYVLTKGMHPFDCGDRYMREVNIRKGQYNLKPLEVLGDYAFEATDLISSMLDAEPKRRPSARQVMAHPFFWPAKKRLNFLCDVSDHFEKEKRDPPTAALQELERWAPDVCRGDFLKLLGKDFVESMGKQRKYTGTRLLDLLRALRNKKNHYEDMPEKLQKEVGPLPDGYLSYWTRKFPNLLIVCWNIVYEVQWDEVDRFKEYYEPAGI